MTGRKNTVLSFCILGLASSAFAQEPVRAKLVEVISRPLEGTSTLPGELASFRTIGVHARVSGFVESVRVDRGSKVRKGDVLATVTAPEMEARVAELRARVVEVESRRAEAQARLVAAESTLNRLREAARTPGVVAGNDIVLAEAAVEAERGRIASIDKSAEAARASVAAFEEMMRYLDVRAEFDGVISERLAHEGSLAGPENKEGQPLFQLDQVDRLRLVVAVPESLVGGIRRGARVTFQVAAHRGEAFTGVVARPALTVDAKTRTMPVELDVQNPGGRLAPGMYAEVAWPQGRGRPSLLVPPRAIKATTERVFVVRVAEGAAEWVDVRRGAQVGDLVEVFGDLRAGDRIFERATDEVRPGARVTAE
ncbi:MAG: efflux RND transporter periplasmic adaptor subunit [Bryobacterales bacterium]|nr:efflux RND transporter periplasmic adaptor subunit [Bryobacterales bacterium]